MYRKLISRVFKHSVQAEKKKCKDYENTRQKDLYNTLLIPELFISFGSAVGPFTIKLLEQGQV